MNMKDPGKKEEKAPAPNFIKEKETAQKDASKSAVAKEPGKVSSVGEETKRKCAEFNRQQEDFARSLKKGWEKTGKIKENAYIIDMGFEKNEKELYDKIEKSRSEVRAELDELHRILGKYEEKIRYKDEAEGELQALEEVKVMLGDKLNNIAKRIGRLKVRRNSDLTKLFAEAKECEEEVKRSGDDILDFEREYTKFLSMMGKISG
jgi:hypothetical protein